MRSKLETSPRGWVYLSVSIPMLRCLLFSHCGLISDRNQISPACSRVSSRNQLTSLSEPQKSAPQQFLLGTSRKCSFSWYIPQTPILRMKDTSWIPQTQVHPSNVAALSCLLQKLSIVKGEDTDVNDFIQFPSLKVKVKSLSPCESMDCSPERLLHLWGFQARILEWVAISFSRGVFPTQGSNPGLPHCRQMLYPLSHKYKYTFHLFHDTTLYSTGFVNFPFVRSKGWERGRLCVSNPSPNPSPIRQVSHLLFLYIAMANPVHHLTDKTPNV